MVEKKNTNYEASAVNLTDSPVTIDAYTQYRNAVESLSKASRAIDDAVPVELIKIRDAASTWVDDCFKNVKATIEKYGGFQNLQDGHYALQQRRVSKEYHAGVLEVEYPQLTSDVLVTAINVPALEAIIKRGAVTEEELKKTGVITTKESLAFIIK
jgi:hypothetical protein